MSDKRLKTVLFLSVFLSCLLLVNWHYDFDFTSGTPFNIRAFVYNMFFARKVNLDHFWSSAGIDLAYSPNGHLYPGYPPGAAFVTLPFFAVEQVITWLHTHLWGPMNGTLAWWLESVCIALPSMLALALTSVLLFDVLPRFDVSRKMSLLTAWALPFTTFVLPYATVIHYHTLAMFWVFLSLWATLKITPLRFKCIALAGFALGMAGLTEYATILCAIPISGYLLFRLVEAEVPTLRVEELAAPLKRLWPFAVGVAIPLSVLAVYNWQSFGAPWAFSHQFHGKFPLDLNYYLSQPINTRVELSKRLIPKTLVFGLAPWVSFFGLFLSPLRGLIFHAPLIVLAPFGIVTLWKKQRGEVLTLVGYIGVTTLLYSFWKEWWGGASYGPRFLISTLPIWFLFVGFALDRLRSSIAYFLMPIAFFVANSAALTGLRDFVRGSDTAAPWRLVPLERVQKFMVAVSTFDDSKLSPFIFRFHSELPVLSSFSPLILYSSFLILFSIPNFLSFLPFHP